MFNAISFKFIPPNTSSSGDDYTLIQNIHKDNEDQVGFPLEDDLTGDDFTTSDDDE